MSTADLAMRMNVTHLASKYDRMEKYFGGDAELLAVLTKGESRKVRTGQAAQEAFSSLTDPYTFHTTMDEGAWSWNLVMHLKDEKRPLDQRISMLTSFLTRIRDLETQPKQFFASSVDHAGNTWAPLWVRLIDRLEALSKRLPSRAQELIQEAYRKYNDGEKGISARRSEHGIQMAQFDTIFTGDQFKALRERLIRPETGLFSLSRAGSFVLETPEFEKRLEFLKQYFTALQAQPGLELSQVLVQHMEKHLREYLKWYQREIPPEVRAICAQGIGAFRSKGP